MTRSISAITLLVPDYDEAIAHYCGDLGFLLLEDTPLGEGKRWVRVAPDKGGFSLLLARAANDRQRAAIGMQAGGRVFLFLHTNDFARDHAAFRAKGIRFTEVPRQESYGMVAVFEDKFGNLWDLIEPRPLA
jgi:catechol 2,3-dioxygenase-like lactoylglutathione lyase family enzyme